MDAPHTDRLIFVGAEAEIRRSTYLGIATVEKLRVPKPYRSPELDARVRRERTRAEALLLAEAGANGVPVPRVLDVDAARGALQIEAVDGPQLRVLLEREDPRAVALCREFGRLVGRLHDAGIVHGDLTTSNVIVRLDDPVLIDFGLAHKSRDVEDRGVDMHLVERTFESTHPGHPEWFASFVDGYRGSWPDADAVLTRMDAIKARGRYV